MYNIIIYNKYYSKVYILYIYENGVYILLVIAYT